MHTSVAPADSLWTQRRLRNRVTHVKNWYNSRCRRMIIMNSVLAARPIGVLAKIVARLLGEG